MSMSNKKRREKKAKAKFNEALENRINNLKKIIKEKNNERDTRIISKSRYEF